MCRFFQGGGDGDGSGCEAGDNCPFMHSENMLEEEGRRGRWERRNNDNEDNNVKKSSNSELGGEGSCCGICLDDVVKSRKR